MTSFVVPGQLITSEHGYLRGHGSFLKESPDGPLLISSIAGQIERVNKLISVKPLKSRYVGEVGDLVVGRVTTVDSKRWKVDISAQKDAMLQLSSVTLPGGVQRMRTYEDQLQMRTLFVEGDLVCAEIQNINSDGIAALHTRSLKYGKLENGQLTVVPAILVKRLPKHYVSLPFGVDIIFGKNGLIWVTRTLPQSWKAAIENEQSSGAVADVTAGVGRSLDDSMPQSADVLQRLKARHAATPLLREECLNIARVCNCIQALSFHAITISPDNIIHAHQRSLELKFQPKDLLLEEHSTRIVEHLAK